MTVLFTSIVTTLRIERTAHGRHKVILSHPRNQASITIPAGELRHLIAELTAYADTQEKQ